MARLVYGVPASCGRVPELAKSRRCVGAGVGAACVFPWPPFVRGRVLLVWRKTGMSSQLVTAGWADAKRIERVINDAFAGTSHDGNVV